MKKSPINEYSDFFFVLSYSHVTHKSSQVSSSNCVMIFGHISLTFSHLICSLAVNLSSYSFTLPSSCFPFGFVSTTMFDETKSCVYHVFLNMFNARPHTKKNHYNIGSWHWPLYKIDPSFQNWWKFSKKPSFCTTFWASHCKAAKCLPKSLSNLWVLLRIEPQQMIFYTTSSSITKVICICWLTITLW